MNGWHADLSGGPVLARGPDGGPQPDGGYAGRSWGSRDRIGGADARCGWGLVGDGYRGGGGAGADERDAESRDLKQRESRQSTGPRYRELWGPISRALGPPS